MISIIVTCFNESEIINEFILTLNKEISKINEKFEVIFVDNKSSDGTLEIIKNNVGLFKSYKIISLSNYFGKESGILAGLDNSEGDSIIIMDPDLEDPPELINDLIMKWKEGYEVVYATRNKVQLPFYKNILKKAFYQVFKIFTTQGFNIPSNTGDYRIIDKTLDGNPTELRLIYSACDLILAPSTLEAFGQIDALVNNAALTNRGKIEETDADFFDRIISVNTRAPLLLTRALMPELKRTKGCVLNIGSVLAHCGQANLLAYAVSKGGLMTMTRNLADAHGQDGVRFNQLNVGWTLTDNDYGIENVWYFFLLENRSDRPSHSLQYQTRYRLWLIY